MEPKVFLLLYSFPERKIKHMVPVSDFFNLLTYYITFYVPIMPHAVYVCLHRVCVYIVMPSNVILRPSINCLGLG